MEPFVIDIQEIKVAVDAVVFAYVHEQLHVLLVQRKYAPFEGQWAFPGGFVRQDEDLEVAAERELKEETEFDTIPFIQQLATFGKVDRDPRRRVISVAYLLFSSEMPAVKGGTDASDAKWFELSQMPHPLAFDHEDIYAEAIHRLKDRLRYSTAGKYLMPKEFTKPELEKLYKLALKDDFVQSMFDSYLDCNYYTEKQGERYSFR